eukprot:jgi/Galph1/2088/GphlegSOOS_G749.1
MSSPSATTHHRQSVGGILKKPQDQVDSKSSSERKKRVRLQWDEDNLQKNEVEREPRCSISEPKTPYHSAYRSDSDSEASIDRRSVDEGQEIQQFRIETAISSLNYSQEESEYSSNSSQSTPRSSASREEFEKKRKSHYDEYKVAKYFRQRVGDIFNEEPQQVEEETVATSIESEPVSPEKSETSQDEGNSV